MNRSRSLVAGVGAAALVLASIATSGTMAVAGTRELEEGATNFRATFGLNSSASVVRASLTDTEKYSNLDWGVRLTKAEAAEMQERSNIVDRSMGAVREAIKRDGYAGVYYDQQRGGIPVFLFSEGRSASEAVVVKAAGSQGVKVLKVERSWADLENIQVAVSNKEGALDKHGIQLTAVGLDTKNNRVAVGVDSDVAMARDVLAEFGDAVMVAREGASSADACTGVKNCPKAKGGLEINGNNGHRCTAGFVGERTDGNDHLVLMTAGHCLHLSYSWDHKTDDVGNREKWIWSSSYNNYPTIPADVGIINLDSGFEPASKNKMLTHNNNSQVYVQDYMPSLAGHGQYVPVCRIGAGSAYEEDYPAHVCGAIITLQERSLSCTGEGGGEQPPCAWVTNTVKVDFDSTSGDSGAPYWRVNEDDEIEAMGLHVHSGEDGDHPKATNAGKGRYIPISRALNKLDSNQGVTMHLCLNVNCN